MQEFRISEEEYVQALSVHYARTYISSAGTFAMWLLLSAVFLSGAFLLDSTYLWHIAILFSALSACAWFVILPFLRRRRAEAAYREHKAVRDSVIMGFDDEGVEASAESGSFRLKWEDFVKYQENKNMFLLYESRAFMRMVPKRAFEDDAELDDFRQHLLKIGYK